MPDREKILKGVECCIEVGSCAECPYYENGVMCSDRMIDDLKELLKEQEPIRPKIVHDPVYGGQVWRCGNCNVLIVKDPYCPKCGRAVKW